ncbi:MAG TPA: hypothetical protein VK148_13090 [Xanthobacteraceae bacterium]|jgi:hypothetical protein|nr:hypothetical protein [Xanthobacteraceae bacterium]
MRGSFAGSAAVLLISTGMLLAAPVGRIAPKDIETLFFNGKPFTASTTSNVKYRMVFSADGTMTREPMAKSGSKSKSKSSASPGPKTEGTWKLSADGFCSTWKDSKENCYRVHENGANKWAVVVSTQAVAYWSK